MSVRLQQAIAPFILGGALVTSIAVVAPQIFAAQSSPVVAELQAESALSTSADTTNDDGSVDMSHWQETGGSMTPYVSGKIKKNK